MARFFIDRPIFAIVIAILIMLAGGLSIVSLPIEQYPTIAPPSIQISATYPGASAQTVENTVVQVIEQQMSGLDHLLYLSSNSRRLRHGDDHADLRGRHQSRHRAGAGAEQAAARDAACCPQQVQQAGIRVTKSSNGFLLVAGFVSTDNSMSQLRHRQLRRLARAGSAEPHRRRRQLQRVRHAVRDAHLARPGQAQQLRA